MKKQYFKKTLSSLAIGCSVLLAGCNNKESVTEESAGAAVNQYLAKYGDMCLSLNKWPVEVDEHEMDMEKMFPNSLANRMKALQALGLVSETDGEVDQLLRGMPTGRRLKVRRYDLSSKGAKFYRGNVVQHAALSGSNPKVVGDLCYGKMAVDKVVKIDFLPETAPDKVYNVRYLYKVDGLADWATTPEFQKAYPGAAKLINGAGKEVETNGVKVTPSGLVPLAPHDI